MQEEPYSQSTNSLLKHVPGHLFTFEEKIWGMSLQQLLMDLGVGTASFSLTAPLPLTPRLLVCILITLLALVLVHGKIQGHALGYWLYLYVRSKMRPAVTIWQSATIRDNAKTLQGGKPLPSLQASWLPIEEMQRGTLGACDQRKGNTIFRFWMVFEVEGKNVRLLPEYDQMRVFQRFEAFLTGLEFHLQFLSYTEQIDPASAPALLTQKEAIATLSGTPRLQRLQQASVLVQEQQMTTCTHTRHFILVAASGAEASLRFPDGPSPSRLSVLWSRLPFQKAGEISRSQVEDHLRIRTSVVRKAFQHLDMRIWQLEDRELLQLFAHCLMPGDTAPSFLPELVETPKRVAPPMSNVLPPTRKTPGGKEDTAAAVDAFPLATDLSPQDQFPGLPQMMSQRRMFSQRYQKRVEGMHGTFLYESAHAQTGFETGVFAMVDLIAPSRIEVHPDWLEVQAGTHTRCLRTFTITGYGHHLLAGWMNDLHELGLPMLISSHFEPCDSHLMIMKLEQALTRLESKRLADQKTLRLPKAEQSIEAEQIRQVTKALSSRRLKIFEVSMTICVHAGNFERLEQRSRYLLSHLRDMQIRARTTTREHDVAWQSCLPLSLDLLQNWITLPSDVASTFLPATSGVVGTPTGVFLGYTGTDLSRRPVYFNPWSPDKKVANPHVVVVGESGMGKSFLVKNIVTGLLGLGLADVVTLDRDDDYLRLHQQLPGESQRYNLARQCPINLLDLPFGPDDVDPNDPADILSEFFDNMLTAGLSLLLTDEDSRLSKQEEAYLIQVARATYAASGITHEAIRRNPQTVLLPSPTLSLFLAMMKKLPSSLKSMQYSLLERLEKAAYLFQDEQTSISIDKPLTTFSIRELHEKWYGLMSYVVQNFLMRHRALKRDERYLAYVVEEASYLLKHPAGRRYLEQGSRGFRKLGIAQITLSQHPRDFLEAGQVVLSNAGTAFFFGMQRTAAEKLNLAEALERTIVESIPGHCVMRLGNEYAALTVWTNPVYHDLFTTDPAERRILRIQEQARKKQHQESGS